MQETNKQIIVIYKEKFFILDTEMTSSKSYFYDESLMNDFKENHVMALYRFGFRNSLKEMTPSLAFLHKVAAAFVKSLASDPDIEVTRIPQPVSSETLGMLLDCVPYAIGGEYITYGWIHEIWNMLSGVFEEEIGKWGESVSDYLRAQDPDLNVAGKKRGQIKQSDTLYLHVYQKILDGIRSFEYDENSPLPAERVICKKYHVSRATVRRALDKLKADGYIYTLPNNGSFIRPQVFEQPLTKFYSFTDELKNSNIIINNHIVAYELIQIDHTLAKKIAYPQGTVFHKLVRLRSAKEYPLMLETTYLPQERFHTIDISFLENRGSLYEYLRNTYGFHIDRAVESFHPVNPNARERDLLKIPTATPCMFLERFSYENNSIIEYTLSIVRGDKYSFTVNLTV